MHYLENSDQIDKGEDHRRIYDHVFDYKNGEANEEVAYPHLKRESEAKPQIALFAKDIMNNDLVESKMSSLRHAQEEYNRVAGIKHKAVNG